MDQKKDLNSNHEIIDEQEVIENLLDGNAKQSNSQKQKGPDALNTAIVMTVLNIILKPIIVILTLPLTIMTFGLFYVVVNGFLLWVADYLMGPSFEINSFGLAILASVFISLLRMGINHYILKEDSLKINI